MKEKHRMFISMRGSSKIISEATVTLLDSRTVKVQTWNEAGATYVTYFFLEEGLEEKTKAQLYEYLREQGIQLEKTFSRGRVSLQKFVGEDKKRYWGLTVVAVKV